MLININFIRDQEFNFEVTLIDARGHEFEIVIRKMGARRIVPVVA